MKIEVCKRGYPGKRYSGKNAKNAKAYLSESFNAAAAAGGQGALQSRGSQRIRHDLATGKQQGVKGQSSPETWESFVVQSLNHV